ncbi:hypothetical protein [Pseudomonas sp. CHM02]|uniref:tautomerase family protein n=1 Tax=Pseudomonas sp. CHM02 TaxID=1463662 RepID=UPI0006860A24|nr:hypothetical protein [Pseudomonas sp. CHM02]
MLEFEAECSLYLRGDNSEPMGYITVAVFANPDQRGYAQLSPMIAKLFHETLGIDPTSVFIKYEDISCWSIAGHVLS